MGQETENLIVGEAGIRHARRSPLARAWVVDPKGNIRTALYSANVCSPLLHIGTTVKGDRILTMGKVRVSDAAEKEGFVLLRDLYAAEDRLEDWEAFLEYQSIAMVADSLEALEDAYLPDEVLRRRDSATKAAIPKLRRPQRERQAAAKTEKKEKQ